MLVILRTSGNLRPVASRIRASKEEGGVCQVEMFSGCQKVVKCCVELIGYVNKGGFIIIECMSVFLPTAASNAEYCIQPSLPAAKRSAMESNSGRRRRTPVSSKIVPKSSSRTYNIITDYTFQISCKRLNE